MAQGIFGGMTNYDDQSLEDILTDLRHWVDYTKEIKNFIEQGTKTLKESGYWNRVPFNFQTILISSIKTQQTFLHDFKLIMNAIQNERLSSREVELMKRIGLNAEDYNVQYGKSYKEDSDWKDYGNKDFKVVENLYADGRDYFITIQDASNISTRLSDYFNPISHSVNQSVHQLISGNNNIVAGYNNGTMNKTEINVNDFSNEVDSALEKIKSIEEVSPALKDHIMEVLKESKEAVLQDNLEAQSISKTKMKSFLIGAGANAINLVHLLGTYSSIASYFEL
ncbi:hypothetical protein A1A1_00155 [Planococcus antarcticus DSM 14505]|uniref:Uncharacterized protein n=1 Tax=Planococcus antarcticus DSM 14505 TaxID=1185653 RepID=A0AA87IP98_9BACL|nr:hypothetical protein [Planococcus antarcticus]EIM08463.1 hypothetical protein A1A1_00155 [Planococcus antarcticus DSM 14505]